MGGTVWGRASCFLLPTSGLLCPVGMHGGKGQSLPSGRRLHVRVLAQGEMRVGRKHCVARRHSCGSPKRWELLQRWAMRATPMPCLHLVLLRCTFLWPGPPGPEVEEEHSISFLAGLSLQPEVLRLGQDREEHWVLK